MSAKSAEQHEDSDKIVAFQIVQFLQTFKEKNESASANIDSACQSIEAAFGIEGSSASDFSTLSYYPTGLTELVQAGAESLGAQTCEQGQQEMANNSKFKAFLSTVTERGYFKGAEPGSIDYLKREAKVIAKFRAKYHPADSPTKNAAAPTSASDSEAKAKAAEEKKAAGNTAIGKKNYEEAVGLYSEAIALCPRGPNSHIYYCNRAAAYCHQNNYQLAASDCEAALALSPSYVKAYSRLGLARFFLGQYEAAVNAYQRAADLEPGTKSHLDSLKQAQQKVREEADKKKRASSPAATAPNPMGGMPGGMPDLSALAGMMGGAGGGGLASLLQNPAMMQMAQQMMSDPNMMAQAQQMMQNPAMMAQAQQMMQGLGGAGGMPDLSALAGMMGGAGGGGTNGQMPSFSGFAEEEDASSLAPLSTASWWGYAT